MGARPRHVLHPGFRRLPCTCARNRDELLEGILQELLEPISTVDSGFVEVDLHKLAEILFDLYNGARGTAVRRLLVDEPRNPATARDWAALKTSLIKSARAIVVRGIQRGELAEGTHPTLVLDMLAGAIFNHFNATPPDMEERVFRSMSAYIDNLVAYIFKPIRLGSR